jgi:hypothetical protein
MTYEALLSGSGNAIAARPADGWPGHRAEPERARRRAPLLGQAKHRIIVCA